MTTAAERSSWLRTRGARLAALLLLLLAGLAIGYGIWRGFGFRPLGELLPEWRATLLVWLESVPPLVFVAAFAVLPAVGFPLSPFYLTAGVVLGGLTGGLLGAWACLAVNLALAYFLTVTVARPFVAWLIQRRGLAVPQITPKNQRQVTVLVRLSPLPYSLQNFVLALGGVEFRRYMLWSFPIQGAIGGAVMVFGGSLLQGRFGLALTALFVLLVIIVGLSWWRRRRSPAAHDLEPGTS